MSHKHFLSACNAVNVVNTHNVALQLDLAIPSHSMLGNPGYKKTQKNTGGKHSPGLWSAEFSSPGIWNPGNDWNSESKFR